MPSHIDRRRSCSDRQRGKHALLSRGQIGGGNLRPFTQVSFGGPARALGVNGGPSRRGLTAHHLRPAIGAPFPASACSSVALQRPRPRTSPICRVYPLIRQLGAPSICLSAHLHIRTSLLHPARSVISHRRSSSPLLGLLHRRRRYHCLCLLLLPTRPHLLGILYPSDVSPGSVRLSPWTKCPTHTLPRIDVPPRSRIGTPTDWASPGLELVLNRN